MASCTDAANALPSCSLSAAGTVPLCSGTSGGGFPANAPQVFNSNAVYGDGSAMKAAQALTRFNAPRTPVSSDQDAAEYGNPCIRAGVPDAADLRAGAPAPAWNVVGTTTVLGCCVQPAAPGTSATPNDRVTRLTAFSTASSPGARDAANIVGGVPQDLTGLTKAWGIATVQQLYKKLAAKQKASGPMFLHGGTHADNVGAAADTFTIKYKDETWTQNAVLWCRHTGDAYSAALDPFGTARPAPVGVAINHRPSTADSGCKTCAVALLEAAASKTADATADCSKPYSQQCAGAALDEQVTVDADDGTTMAPLDVYLGLAKLNSGVSFDSRGVTAPANAQSRCGGCFVTRDQYGPGTFAVLANLPPVALLPDADPSVALDTNLFVDDATGMGRYGAASGVTAANGKPAGRGYVFALWTFNYTEAYSPDVDHIANWPFSMTNAPYSPLSSDVETRKGQQDWNQTLADTPTTVEALDARSALQNVLNKTLPTPAGSIAWPDAGVDSMMVPDEDDYFTIHNHEIDIEIPANSAQMYGPGGKQPGLNTANFNTWLTDIGDYSPGTQSLYQQVQSTLGQGFYAAVGPADDENTYHEYKFAWVVDPAEADAASDATSVAATCASANTYVAFFLDGVEKWRSHRFVPRRSGRVVFGLWPGWWGTNFQPMAYNHVYAKIARVDIVPQAVPTDTGFAPQASLVTNASQMYDQRLPDGSVIACGIGTITQRAPVQLGPTPPPSPPPPSPPPPSPSPSPAPRTHSRAPVPWWAWVVIGVVVVLALALGLGLGLGLRLRLPKKRTLAAAR